MGAALLATLRESFNRVMGVVLVAFSIVTVGVYIATLKIGRLPDGTLAMESPAHPWEAATTAAVWKFEVLYQQTAGLWYFLGIFACASLLTSYLEKGWAEFLFPKGVTRAKLLLGRYFGALGVFCIAVLALNLPLAFYLWLRVGVNPGRYLLALLFPLFGFAAVLALMTVVAVAFAHPAPPIMAGFLQIFISILLVQREARLYDVVPWQWARALIDWVYYILPKNLELEENGLFFLHSAEIKSWWPLWSTALFLVGALGFAYWLLRRKDF